MMVSRQSDTSRRTRPIWPLRALSSSLAVSGSGCLDTSPATRRRFVVSRKMDVSGQRFGRLVAMREVPSLRGYSLWLCHCDCGQPATVRLGHLRSGAIRSCGCLSAEARHLPRGTAVDMSGRRVGRLLVVGEDGRTPEGAACWLCLCACGTTLRVDGRRLRKGSTQSCGCLAREQSSTRLAARLRGQPSTRRSELTGQRFGRWLVVTWALGGDGYRTAWLCRCECGAERVVAGERLRNGSSQSCGCLAGEQVAERMRQKMGALGVSWKGTKAGYTAKHLRVVKARGRPVGCERCGYSDADARYEWANLSGEYDDVGDFARMCVQCHRIYDAMRRIHARVSR